MWNLSNFGGNAYPQYGNRVPGASVGQSNQYRNFVPQVELDGEFTLPLVDLLPQTTKIFGKLDLSNELPGERGMSLRLNPRSLCQQDMLVLCLYAIFYSRKNLQALRAYLEFRKKLVIQTLPRKADSESEEEEDRYSPTPVDQHNRSVTTWESSASDNSGDNYGRRSITSSLENRPGSRNKRYSNSESSESDDEFESRVLAERRIELKCGMIIEDVTRLKNWLTAILHPLCDADPAALAKYVLALIKKDKPEKELRQSMSDQLDVFLQKETKTFVDRLFELLKTKEYLTSPPPPIVPKDDSSRKSAATESDNNVSTSDASVTNAEVLSVSEEMDTINLSLNSTETMEEQASSGSKDKEDPKSSKFSAARKEDDRERGRRRRTRSRSPMRRLPARLGRSRSRNRDRKYQPRKTWRSRRTRSRSIPRNRSPSPLRNRSRSNPRYRRHSSRSRSRSPRDRNRSRSRSPLREKSEKKEPVAGFPHEERAVDNVVRDIGEKPAVQSVVVVKSADKDKGNRCRDFDEKGLCMRGELCPFDHGNDPVVLEDVVIPGVNTTTSQVGFVPPINTDAYGAPLMRPTLHSNIGGEYYPDNPSIDPGMGWGNGPFRPRGIGFEMMRGRGMMPRQIAPFPHGPAHRDLISVPVMGMPPSLEPHGQLGMHAHLGMMRGMHGRGRGRGGFDHSRLGYKPTRNFANCSLEVKKIPREHNNIMDLNSHFQKFGKIVNIQINFESDPEAALVTFSLPSEAHAAYRSTEAVLNNRFIRVFWHSKEKENEDAVDDVLLPRIPVRDRLGGHENEEKPETQEKVLVSGNNVTKTVYNPALLVKKADSLDKMAAVEAIKKNQEMLAAQESLKKQQQEKKAETLKLMSDLRKRKQEMLDKLLNNQKKLISKLESGKGTLKKEEQEDLMKMIKTLQGKIEELKKDLEDSAPKPHPLAKPMTKEDVKKTQRELLDTELELFNKEQEGGDTFQLQQRLIELRKKARSYGLNPRGRGGFRGSSRGFSSRGRGAIRASRTVDRRTTCIRVSNFPKERIPEILPHFGQFGTVTEYDTEMDPPCMTLTFLTRKSAEQAILKGKYFGNMQIDVVWVENPRNSVSQDSTTRPGNLQEGLENGATVEDEELGDILANEILLTYEEDDEDDDRSWRR